jgi:protein-tyrosine phosphatase
MNRTTDDAGDSGTVLIVCTGNVCRSPLMERLLVANLAGRSGALRPERRVRVHSAGTEAQVGEPMTGQAARELVRLGGDPDRFVSRQLTTDMVASADLVVTATRAHRAAVVTLLPRATRYTFTAVELARLLGSVDLSSLRGGARARVLNLAVAAASYRGFTPPVAPGADDVLDPYGRPSADYRRASDQMAPAIAALAAAIAG